MDRRPPPLLGALGARPTGGFIVTMREDATEVGMGALGRAAARAGGPGARCIDCEELGALDTGEAEGPLLLSDYGVAVIPPRAAGLMAALSRDEAVAEARPETFLFALGGARAAFAPGPADLEDDAARTWGVAAVGAPSFPFDGTGVALAVLDTGIDAGHPDFASREIVARGFVSGEPEGAARRDVQGHGTHCAGTAAGPRAEGDRPRYGVAPEARLHVAKVLGDDGAGREGDILAGMAWAIEAGCVVISMSLGRSAAPGEAPSLVYERLGRRALERGCLILAAAGNDSARAQGIVAPVGAPANSPSILAVGAVDPALDPAPFSNGGLDADTGGAVDLAGPGVDVFSCVPRPRLYRALSGTSMACPHAAGVAALLAQSDPGLRGGRLWRALAEGVLPLPYPARDVGAGLARAPAPVLEPGPVA